MNFNGVYLLYVFSKSHRNVESNETFMKRFYSKRISTDREFCPETSK